MDHGRPSAQPRARMPGIALVAAACVVLSGLGLATTARAFSAATGGVVLDLYGGLHQFGGANIDTAGAPYWPNWDIARAVDVLPDGSGGWTLDGWGGIHSWGNPATTPITSPFASAGRDLARGFVVLPDEHSGYVLDAYGGVHEFGPKAPRMTPAFNWNGWDIARGIAIATDGTGTAIGGWVLDGFGGVHEFGSPPATTGGPSYFSGRDVWQKLHLAPSGALYAVGKWGVLEDTGLAPSVSGYTDWGAWNATRDVVLFSPAPGTSTQPASVDAQREFAAASAPTGGVTLDLYGGLHPFGGFPLNAAGAPYWAGWGIARGLALLTDGTGGWTLDGWGGIHSWGAAPAISQPPLWPGWDVARALAILPDNRSGYILDAFGGLHQFGPNAPAFAPPEYWTGWDVARGLAVATDSSGRAIGGWVLDGFGGVHAFGSVPALPGPTAYYPGRAVWEKLHLSLDGHHLYGVGSFGVVSAPGMSPAWAGYPDWGAWNATRDVVLSNPLAGGGPAAPVSAAARMAFTLATSNGVITKPGCGAYGWSPPAGKWIVISLECQELSAYQDGQLLEDTLVTTGRPALPTQRGHTHVLNKNHPFLMVSPWPRGSQYYYNPSWVQYVTWIWPNGTGIHDAYWEPDSALGPGSPLGPYASHGCVHVTLPLAQWIYGWADVGIPVDVV